MAKTHTATKASSVSIEDFEKLERRVSTLEKRIQQLFPVKPKARKQREYTEEQRRAIRARLLAGQEAHKQKQIEARTT